MIPLRLTFSSSSRRKSSAVQDDIPYHNLTSTSYVPSTSEYNPQHLELSRPILRRSWHILLGTRCLHMLSGKRIGSCDKGEAWCLWGRARLSSTRR